MDVNKEETSEVIVYSLLWKIRDLKDELARIYYTMHFNDDIKLRQMEKDLIKAEKRLKKENIGFVN